MTGHSGIEPPDPSETCFVADVDDDFGKLDVPQQITETIRVATAYLKTTRYVGQVDSLGFLTYGDLDVREKRLAEQMQLTIHAQIIPEEGVILGPGGVELDVYLHLGVPARQKSGRVYGRLLPSVWQDITVLISTVFVRFPDDPCPGQASNAWCGYIATPRFNEISFVFSGTGRLTMEIDWMTLGPAPGDLQGLACHPVLLLHGWGQDATQMSRIWAPGLSSLDIPSYAMNLEPEGTIHTNAAQIGRAVTDLKARFGVDKLNIVGFSKGGIDAREYIRTNNDVERLVMLASPNGGSFVADLNWAPLQNATQMTTESMSYYNSTTAMNAKVKYETVAAAYDSWRASVFDQVYGPNDEVVSQDSVETNIPGPGPGEPDNHARFATSVNDAESQGICAQLNVTNHSCLPNNEIIFTDTAQLILSTVDPPDGQSLVGPHPSRPDRIRLPGDAGQDRLQGVSSQSGLVPPQGVTQSHTVLIDAVDQALFYAFADGDLLSLELVSPSGRRVDPTTPSTDAAVGYAPLLNAEFFWYATYSIESPEAGPWTVEVTGTSAPAADSAYGVAAFAQVPPELGVSMTVELDRDSYVVGEDVAVSATVTSGGAPVTDAAVTAGISRPDGAAGTAINLSPERTAAGKYTGALTCGSLPGLCSIVVSAEGSAPAFSRQQVLRANVVPSASVFSGAFSDQGVDTDGDGRFDQLAIDVGVEIDVAAEYRIFGTLRDSSGGFIEQVRIVQQLAPGAPPVSLLFDGALLFDLGLDGPYVLDELFIEDLATLTGLARGPAYTTAAYSHDAFKRPVCLLTGKSGDHGVNTDPGDQRPYEELVVEVEVDTLVAAGVRAVATLAAEDGTVISTRQTYASLAAGLNTLGFYFPAPVIYSAGQDGPYNLLLFNLWEDAAGPASVSLRAPGVVAVTQPYALADFAESPVYTIGGTVTGLEGEGLQLMERVSNASVEPGNGPYSFSPSISVGSAYDVEVVTQPTSPMQVCTVVNGSGTVGPSGVDDINVACVTTVPEAGLDPDFGSAGKVTGHAEGATAVALQCDGMIVLLGDRTLTRYDSEGNLDGGFGAGGVVSDVLGANDFAVAKSVAIQADGKIVVAGYTPVDPQGAHYDWALARYTTTGILDPEFGGGRVVTTDFAGGTDYGRCVLIQDGGAIVVAGLVVSAPGALGESEVGLARYTSDGTLDPSFGSGGKVMTPIPGGSGSAVSAVLQTDGKILVLVLADWGDESPDFGLVRYTADGRPDPDFGDGDVVRARFAAPQPTGLAIQSDGRIVVVGCGGGPFAVACFDAAGHPDPGFGGGALVTTTFDGEEAAAQAIAIQDDGAIVVAGYTRAGSSEELGKEDFAVARYTSDGRPDDTFGDGGQRTFDFFGGGDEAQCIAIQPDGKIVVAGSASREASLGLLRLLP